MKTHTSEFKNQIKTLGRQLKATVTYGNTVLEEELFSVNPHYEGNILKSVMKQLDIESSVDIPLETVINLQIGILVGSAYEMLNFGNYIVFKSEKQEDTNTYKITCYDKMLYAMKQNEDLGVTYPITLRNYLTALGTKIGLSVSQETFYNETQEIPSELYVGLEYTYRDILDEIAQASGGTIYINSSDEIEVKYPTNTGDEIDEEFLKDVNVRFGKIYGPINSIVLSRSGESDNVYLRDEESVTENGLCEVKIVDNQIMNLNNRSDYLHGILTALNGLTYSINDFTSTGILYYELLDKYNVRVAETSYPCLMLNDEIDIGTGIVEMIHTDEPKESETDYSKADKTDRKINQTYLIVDKQNQIIESMINTVNEQNNKISSVTQSVDEINSKIQDIADITVKEESSQGYVTFENINESEPIAINIHPLGTNISYLYPRNDLYPSNTLYMPNRILRFVRTYTENGTTKTQNIDYELPDDLLYYNAENYDEFILSYDTETCQVIKKCKYNADGTVGLLANQITKNYTYPLIQLGDGDYSIQLLGYNSAYLMVRLMASNIYTTQFATKAEMRSEINQTATEITSTVSATYETKQNAITNYSQLQQTATSLQSQINNNNTDISTLQQTAQGLTSTVSQKVGNDEIISKINQSSEAVQINANKISLAGKEINLTGDNTTIKSSNFNVDKNGNMSCSNASVSGTINATNGTFQNCTITNSCSVPASTVSGTLGTSTIPNLNANKLTSGKINSKLLEGVNATFGTLNATAEVHSGGYVDAYLGFSYRDQDGLTTKIAVPTSLTVVNGKITGQTWRRLVFKGGILTAIETSW